MPVNVHDSSVSAARSATRADQSVYAAVKIRAYQALLQQFRKDRTWPKDQVLPPEALKTSLQSVTARSVRKMIEGTEQAAFTELYGGTSHLFYQRLLSLNHGSVLRATQRTLRRNRVFNWNESFFTKNLCTLAAIEQHLQGRVHLGVDLIRVYETYGDHPFTDGEFLALFQQRLRTAMRRHEAREPRVEQVAGSADYAQFLRNRLAELQRSGQVDRLAAATRQFRLSAKGFQAALYLDLFLHNIWFNEPVPSCLHCQGKL